MTKKAIWYGYLQAGKKSSPVVLDTKLETRNPKTIYLFNFVRGKFLEYSRELVEPKLHDLDPDDNLLKELKRAFKAARKIFVVDQNTHKNVTTTAINNIKTTTLPDVGNIPDLIQENTIDNVNASDSAG